MPWRDAANPYSKSVFGYVECSEGQLRTVDHRPADCSESHHFNSQWQKLYSWKSTALDEKENNVNFVYFCTMLFFTVTKYNCLEMLVFAEYLKLNIAGSLVNKGYIKSFD